MVKKRKKEKRKKRGVERTQCACSCPVALKKKKKIVVAQLNGLLILKKKKKKKVKWACVSFGDSGLTGILFCPSPLPPKSPLFLFWAVGANPEKTAHKKG